MPIEVKIELVGWLKRYSPEENPVIIELLFPETVDKVFIKAGIPTEEIGIMKAGENRLSPNHLISENIYIVAYPTILGG
ncbi:hypothetical protein [Alkalibacter saccharofermentans]|uniref:ThiS family protein n=1 Tax=Alkalibacter saccharofermentans DSM 14828 TaxID=1120975 RepID=A0A1M4WAU4_9FIRM|nr:hypothetical protein [Alkalibacter saccharofermentans]SHE78388.1 hypothetical protein SAMN02746064_01178 [Alkalibacter saccharofermentans DSM 14828]